MGFESAKPIVIAIVLAVLWLAETLAPEFADRQGRTRHGAANLAIGLINASILSLGFAGLVVAAAEWARDAEWGLLRMLELPAWIGWPAAILLFDLWMYVWHVLNHKVPLLWRFHAVHHSDAELDATSALRFHPGEVALSSIARLAVVPILGMGALQLAVYELILLPVILLHHSNVALPEPMDRWLRMVIASPRMHWVHHSRYQPETDSNYGSIFSWWDRGFRTFRLRTDPTQLRLGLDAYGPYDARNLIGMLTSPVRKRAATSPSDFRREDPKPQSGVPADSSHLGKDPAPSASIKDARRDMPEK